MGGKDVLTGLLESDIDLWRATVLLPVFGLCESPDRIRRAFASLVVIPEIPSESRCLKTMAE